MLRKSNESFEVVCVGCTSYFLFFSAIKKKEASGDEKNPEISEKILSKKTKMQRLFFF